MSSSPQWHWPPSLSRPASSDERGYSRLPHATTAHRSHAVSSHDLFRAQCGYHERMTPTYSATLPSVLDTRHAKQPHFHSTVPSVPVVGVMQASNTDRSPPSRHGIRGTKLFAALRRSYRNSHQNASDGPLTSGMFSTPAECSVAHFGTKRKSDTSLLQAAPPPSITDIAMGLHTSCTPHLGPTQSQWHADQTGIPRSTNRGRRLQQQPDQSSMSISHSNSSSSSRSLNPPLRSSLKRFPNSDASGGRGSSTSASPHPSRSASPSASASSSVPSTPKSPLSRVSIALANAGSRTRLDRLFGRGTKPSSAASVSNTSLNSSADSDIARVKKAVRFVSILDNIP